MAHESFEDAEAAEVLNRHFISVKVDKEERPDIDSIYMNVCTSLTGSGGWPLTIIMDHTGKPFFAGTYFPKRSRYGRMGLIELLNIVAEKWKNDRRILLESAEKITAFINEQGLAESSHGGAAELINKGLAYFEAAFDKRYGGFGRAPKFPSPHNLLFLMEAHINMENNSFLSMAETTLLSMAKGGIFDHIGFGFSRYSTDEKWLAPHFEKMLYDNALLITAYVRAYEITQNPAYKSVAEKTISYIRREMTHEDGGFFSAEDADSDGVEGKFYVFTPAEIRTVLGESDGKAFCELYDITERGNFENTNIPNQIHRTELDDSLLHLLPALYEYRRKRTSLHKDDKILTAWNSLMIAALADAYRIFGDAEYLEMAENAASFIEKNLSDGDKIFTSYRGGKRTEHGFLDDYAFYIHALLKLNRKERARTLTLKALADFFDEADGGFYLTGKDSEALVARPKEIYDGAIPSGNSVMTLNLLDLNLLTGELGDVLDKQADFMISRAGSAPGGHSFLLYTLLKRDFTVRSASDFVCDENGCRPIN
jgi:hypothetical protein